MGDNQCTRIKQKQIFFKYRTYRLRFVGFFSQPNIANFAYHLELRPKVNCTLKRDPSFQVDPYAPIILYAFAKRKQGESIEITCSISEWPRGDRFNYTPSGQLMKRRFDTRVDIKPLPSRHRFTIGVTTRNGVKVKPGVSGKGMGKIMIRLVNNVQALIRTKLITIYAIDLGAMGVPIKITLSRL